MKVLPLVLLQPNATLRWFLGIVSLWIGATFVLVLRNALTRRLPWRELRKYGQAAKQNRPLRLPDAVLEQVRALGTPAAGDEAYAHYWHFVRVLAAADRLEDENVDARQALSAAINGFVVALVLAVFVAAVLIMIGVPIGSPKG